MKAQSGIEYLTTYGWALLSISIVTGAIFTYYSPECGVESDIFHPDLRLEEEAITADNELHLAFRSVTNDDITIRGVEIGEQGLEQTQTLNLEPGETSAYELAEVEPTNDCLEMEMRINYDIGGLENQYLSGTMQLPAEIIDTIITLLDVGGGEINELRINSNIEPQEGLCIGDTCAELEDIEEEGEYVDRSGDTMNGPLFINNRLEFNCMGDDCSAETGSLQGEVSTTNNTMDGALTISEIVANDDITVSAFQEN